jgi:enoyl-CoA hydratase
VIVERNVPIATVTLNRPERLNALSDEVMRVLVGALGEMDADRDIHAIVLTGSERASAAGADIDEMAGMSAIDFAFGERVERWDALRRRSTILAGRTLSAAEAERAGLVARVVARETVVSEAQDAARAIAARGPIAQRRAREALDWAADMGLSDGLAFERKSLYLAFASEDAREELEAFTEQRRPQWSWK